MWITGSSLLNLRSRSSARARGRRGTDPAVVQVHHGAVAVERRWISPQKSSSSGRRPWCRVRSRAEARRAGRRAARPRSRAPDEPTAIYHVTPMAEELPQSTGLPPTARAGHPLSLCPVCGGPPGAEACFGPFSPPVRAFSAGRLTMSIIASEMRRGMCILYEGEPCRVLDFHHHTPGNLRAMVQAKLRKLRTGTQFEHRFARPTRWTPPISRHTSWSSCTAAATASTS